MIKSKYDKNKYFAHSGSKKINNVDEKETQTADWEHIIWNDTNHINDIK